MFTETVQHGCVPIAFDSFSAVHDIITDGKDGIIIPPFNKRKYAQQLLHLIKNDLSRQIMSVNARENIHRYDAPHIIEQWEKLFNRFVLSENSSTCI